MSNATMKKNPITAWSFSRYNLYDQCPARFKYKHIDKLPDPGSPAMERGKVIHKEGEEFLLNDGLPVPDSFKLFEDQMEELASLDVFAEQQWGFNRAWHPTGWFGKDTWLRVMLDAGVEYEDHTADVIDFKTGKKYGDNGEQMELFALATFFRFRGTKEVVTRLWYVDSGDEDIETFTADQVIPLRDKWTKKVQPMFNDTVFAPRPNDKCCWCPYSASAGGPCVYG